MSQSPTPEHNAYALLNKATLDLTDAEALIVVEELRRKRAAYVQSGTKDTSTVKRKPAAPAVNKDEATKGLLDSIDLALDL
jgi:hypothetical protein